MADCTARLAGMGTGTSVLDGGLVLLPFLLAHWSARPHPWQRGMEAHPAILGWLPLLRPLMHPGRANPIMLPHVLEDPQRVGAKAAGVGLRTVRPLHAAAGSNHVSALLRTANLALG